MQSLLQIILFLELPIICVSFLVMASPQSSPPLSSSATKILTLSASSSQHIPTHEVDTLSLLQQEADGRGIRMAILDTGCDVAARGLQLTTTGEPKYLDFIDCTGDGDIDTSTKKRVTIDTADTTAGTAKVTVVGVSGKNLTLPSTMFNDMDQEVRLGAIRLFDILPKTALRRVQAERKVKFLQVHHARMALAQTKLDQLRLKQHQQQASSKSNDKDTDKDKQDTDKDEKDKEKNDASTASKKEIKETELLLDELQDMVKDYQDTAGPTMDVVLFETPQKDNTIDGDDNKSWQALIDLQADGDLTASTPMAPYGVKQQFGTLQFGSQVTFCVQVYEQGDILSLVCDSGSHGTHVAGIAAANFQDATEDIDSTSNVNSSSPTINVKQRMMDGVAPGAQVLACKIGDNRLGSAETGTGLIRALVAAKQHKCQLVNLSFGEPAWQPDQGRVSQVFDDAVHKWGMTVFTSAGNDGPALSSLGSPGTLASLITVGAYVSPQMMADQYSTLMDNNDNSNNNEDEDSDSLPGASYSFSSRGPTPDGLLPDICAPGGAIAPVPRHTLQGKGQKHGTSMASPSACGVAAVVLSALKAHGIHGVNPHELRRALQNSAKKTPGGNVVLDPFAQGSGLVSASRAVEYIVAHHGKPGQDMAFDVKIPASNNARGIYIRDALQLAGPMTKTVSVKPRFEHSLDKTHEEMENMLSMELELDLIPSQEWVQCPERMTLLSAKERAAGQSFSIRLDPKGLPPGAHYATVDAIDSNDPARGPLFQVPVTVIVPHGIVRTPSFAFAAGGDDVVRSTQLLASDSDKTVEISTSETGIDVSMNYELAPGAPARRFLSVPASAEWASIKIRSISPTAGHSAPHSLILHAVPFVRGDLHNQMIQIKKFFQLNEGIEREFRVQVRGGSTLEVCLQLSWLANSSPTSVIADVEFHSLDVRPPTFVSTQPVRISASTEFGRFGAAAPFRSERINPKATLASVHRTIRPKEYKISAASFDDRDVLPLSDAEIKASVGSTIDEEQQAASNGTLVYKSYLEYAFKLDDSKDDATISVTPRIPSLFHQIYDSPIDSQLWMLQDCNGKLLGYGGCMHEAAAVTLSTKGGADYKLTLRISHPSRSVLEQLKDLPLRLAMKFTKELDCPVYSELDKASTPGVTEDGREAVKETNLRRGAHCDLYVTRPTAKLPDWVQPGDVMSGTIQLNQKCQGATSLNLFYEVPPKSTISDGNKKKDDKKKDGADDDKKDEKELTDSIFKAKISHLAKLRSKKNATAYTSLAEQLKTEKADSLPLLEELLNYAKEAKAPDDEANERKWRALAVATAADAMKSSNGGPVDETAMAQYFGCNNPPPDDEEEEEKKEEAEKTKKETEERRKAWRSALLVKAGTWSDVVSGMKNNEESSEEDKTAFDEAVKELKKWVSAAGDLSDDKEKARHAVVLSRHLRICQGKSVGSLASLRKARKDIPPALYKELTEEMVKVVEGIDGMEYWLQQIEEDLAERYPKVKHQLF